MIELYDKESLFRKKYLNNLINRFTNASLGVEGEEGSYADTKHALNLYFQSQALEYAFDIKKKEMLRIEDIKEIERILTNEEYIDFRKTRAEVYGSLILRSKPKNIYMDMYQLFDNYYNIWKDLDPYLRESLFHIRFLHIHPFEDGNGRTARILLIRNLCANNQIPCVITKETKKEYCNYIEQNDPEGLANFLRNLAQKELTTMIGLYDNLNKNGLIHSNLMTDAEQKRYDENIPYQSTNEYPLRNIEHLLNLFNHSMMSNDNNDSLTITRLHKMLYIEDDESKDNIIQYIDTNTMVINIENNENIFKIKKELNKIIFLINDQETEKEFFEDKLNEHTQEKTKTLK